MVIKTTIISKHTVGIRLNNLEGLKITDFL